MARIRASIGFRSESVRFHAKFAESNNLLLANSIANKIEDDKIREDTLSEISKNIILYKKIRWSNGNTLATEN